MRLRRSPYALLVATLTACAPEPPPSAQMPRAPLLGAMRDDPASKRADAAPPDAAPDGPAPPRARREPHPTTVNGHELADDWYWLRKKGDPEVVAYLEAENAYTDARTKPMQPLVDALYGEMLGRIQETDSSAPVKNGDWLYYERTEKGKQYAILCRKHVPKANGGEPGPEQVLLDLNAVAEHAGYVGLGAGVVSDDGKLFAYALDTTGFRQYVLHVKDLEKNVELPDHAERVDAVAFTRDPRVLFYATEDAQTKRTNQVHRHRLGDDPAKDALVYEEKDERFRVDVERTRSRDYVVVTSSSATTSEVRLLSAREPARPPVVVAPRRQGEEYYVDHAGQQLYIRANDHGRNFRLVSAPVDDPQRARWTEMIPHRNDTMLEDVEAFADHLVLRERHDARATYRSLDTTTSPKAPLSRAIAIDDPVYALAGHERVWPNPDFASHVYRFAYSGPAVPWSTYDADLATGARALVKRDVVPHFDPSKYETERVHVAARDGTEVPVSIVRLKGQKADGTHPLFLRGYGSYGVSYDVDFEETLVSLLDRGVVCAVAHVRGGGEGGKAWHDGGRMQNKRATFTDFIDAAEGLVKAGWARRDAIAIEGGSAGGLLMGAVTNMRPDLWRAVLARVPFVDVMNTMLDSSLPLTTNEYEEWGDPRNPADFDVMRSYSPYDNVEAKAYPPLLVETSYNDSQVMYWEPAKWVARLRATKTDANELLLKVNMKPAGHHGLSGRYDHLREKAFDYAWIATQLGVAR